MVLSLQEWSKFHMGSVQVAMGHSDPFDLKYVAICNEDCEKKNYKGLHIVLIHFYFLDQIINCIQLVYTYRLKETIRLGSFTGYWLRMGADLLEFYWEYGSFATPKIWWLLSLQSLKYLLLVVGICLGELCITLVGYNC